MNPTHIAPFLTALTDWARNRTDLYRLILVGSYARGTARPDSDIDLVLLVENPDAFRADDLWLREIAQAIGREVTHTKDADYGLLWSRHTFFDDGLEVEFGFSSLEWLDDSQSQAVMRDGHIVLI